ncbi:DUF1491 family protein [Acuticoccus sp. MNP-M23]|uniref:DUF1491 family protein n=1 Tax=Acuticoccus sp. MNP-M23 TaxID=3072793 RepID=UPI002814DA95|nr:DUF1491 family protein [Acuticoccus sp. MNP-M23]WMS41685.1 DUF1491 family protein [Acuticoccus sp. MNP-M23]
MAALFDDDPAPRLKAYFWIAGYLRRCSSRGAFVALSRKGDASAGAIFIEILHGLGTDLWAPAPGGDGRVFERVLNSVPGWEVTERMDKEAAFDRDLWLVSVEDRAGRSFLERGEYV